MAPRTTTIAIAATRANNTTTRMLVKWSATSFSVTTPTPFKAEPSRRMALSFVDLVEVGGVDRLEARLVDRKVREPAEDIEQLARGLRVEARCRLVQDRDRHVLDQDLGEPEPLPHAARERPDTLVGDLREPDMLQGGLDPLLALGTLEPHQARGV